MHLPIISTTKIKILCEITETPTGMNFKSISIVDVCICVKFLNCDYGWLLVLEYLLYPDTMNIIMMLANIALQQVHTKNVN